MTIAKVLPLALAIGSFSGVVAADPLTIYGKANLTAQSSDEGEGSFTELKSNNSRVGVKGDVELESGIKAVYLLEWQVDIADLSGSDNIKSRNQYLGLAGSFGEVLFGRKDTVLKDMSKPIDMFNDYEADLKGLWKGENRVSDMVNYTSPDMNGFRIAATYITEDEADGEDGFSVGASYGDTKLKKSKIYAALMMDSDVAGYDIQRALVQGKVGDWTLGAMFHKQEAVGSDQSDSGYNVSAQYAINAWKLKAQYQTLEDDDSWSVGADYKLGKDTKAFFWYSDRSYEVKEDASWLAVGLEHKF